MEIPMFQFQSRRTVLVSLFLAATAFGLLGMNLRPAHAGPLYSISQTKSGLVGSDPLTGSFSQAQLATSSYWLFGGDAAVQGSPYAFSEDSSGLHIGVQATAVAPYAGFYALHKDNAMLSHAVMSVPSSTVPSGYPNVGLYVQTGGVNVNYVVCGGTTSNAGTQWGVALATGDVNGAFQYVPLYLDPSTNQALTRDCTVVTNGANYLAVYLDHSLVYQNSNQNLGYTPPFQFFLETQTSYTGGMFTGTFKNFYMTSGDSITVANMPTSSTAQIVSPSGQVIVKADADSSGKATLPIGQYAMPLTANIQITQLGVVVGSTSSPISIWGGDAYSATLSPGLVGGQVGASPASSGPSLSVAVPTSPSSSVGAAQVGAVPSPATNGHPTGVSTAPLTALSLVAALGGSTRRDSDGSRSHGTQKGSRKSFLGNSD